MLVGKFADDNGNKLENTPEFKQMVSDLMWALGKAKSWGNSKSNMNILDKSEKLIEKYNTLNNEVSDG